MRDSRPRDDGSVPFVSVSRSTALVLVSALLALLVLAGPRLARTGTSSAPEIVAPLEPTTTPDVRSQHTRDERRSWCTWSERFVVLGCIDFETVRVSQTRSSGPVGATSRAELAALNLAAPLVDGIQVLVPRRATATGTAVPEAGADLGCCDGRVGSKPSLATATAEELDELPGVGPVTAQKILDYRTEHGPFRSVDDLDAVPGHRPDARRATARPRDPVRRVVELHWPALLAGSACAGLAGSNWITLGGSALFALVLVSSRGTVTVAAELGEWPRSAALLALTGLGWGAMRLDAMSQSVLLAEVGESGTARLVVTGPARRTPWAIRVPAETREFRGKPLRERVLLVLPVGRSPPRGAILETVVRVTEPRPAENGGFDERAWLARQGHPRGARAGSSWRLDRQPRAASRDVGDRLRDRVEQAVGRGSDGRATRARTRRRPRGGRGAAGAGAGGLSGLRARASTRRFRTERRLSRPRRLRARLAAPSVRRSFESSRLWARSPPTFLRSAGSLPSSAPESPVRWRRSPGSRQGRRDRWHFLALGALVLLAWAPTSLLDPGFQLSFAAVAGIFVGVPRLRARAGAATRCPRAPPKCSAWRSSAVW